MTMTVSAHRGSSAVSRALWMQAWQHSPQWFGAKLRRQLPVTGGRNLADAHLVLAQTPPSRKRGPEALLLSDVGMSTIG